MATNSTPSATVTANAVVAQPVLKRTKSNPSIAATAEAVEQMLSRVKEAHSEHCLMY